MKSKREPSEQPNLSKNKNHSHTKKAGQKISDSVQSATFRLVADSTDDLVWAKDLNGNFIFTNKAICKVLLNTDDVNEPIGKNVMYFVERERARQPDNPDWFTFGEECADSDAITIEQAKTCRFDEYGNVKGKYLYLDVLKSPMWNAEGKMIGTVGFARVVTKERVQEENLRILSQVVETTQQAVVVTNMNNEIIYVNMALVHMLRYSSPTEILGRSMFDFADEDSIRILQEEGLPALLDKGYWKGQLTVRRKDGTFFPSTENCSIVKDEKGNPQYFVAIFDDDTEIYEKEKQLKEEKERAQSYLDIAGVMIVVIDNNGTVSLINKKGCEILGYREDEIVGKNWFEHFLPKDVQEEIKQYARKILKETSQDETYRENSVLTKSGERRLIAWHNTLIKDAAGNPIGHLSSGEDITEQRKAEDALKASEHRYRMLFKMLPYGGELLDTQGNIIECSPEGARMLGYTVEEMKGKHITQFLTDEAIRFYNKNFPSIARGNAKKAEIEMIHKDGSIRNVLRAAQPIKNAQGKIESILTINVDITERIKAGEKQRKLEIQIQQAQRLESLGVLAGGIAHDFNNILTGVLGNAGLAEMSLSPVSPALENIKRIETSAQRAAELCNQLLAYSGKGRFVIQPVNFNHIIEEMTRILEVSISKKIVLKYNLADHLPSVEADIAQMRQIIMNLIINASDAIGEKSGIITITTGAMECDKNYLTEVYLNEDLPEGIYIYIEVSDTGSGMDKETKEKIFDPFFSTKFSGRGLGLAAVLGILRGHKGTIKIYSEVGRGTTFKILLPASKRDTVIFKPKEKSLENWKGSGTILIVDDEDTIRALGKDTLERVGFNVLTAEDGLKAIEIFKEFADEIVAVLLDMTMPHLSGEETFRELRRIRKDVRVILSSGYNEQDATNNFVGKGLAGFIQKPYNPSALIEKIHQTLQPIGPEG